MIEPANLVALNREHRRSDTEAQNIEWSGHRNRPSHDRVYRIKRLQSMPSERPVFRLALRQILGHKFLYVLINGLPWPPTFSGL
jgi:hypothetical protein